MIDCGVVCNWPSREAIHAYLPQAWRDYVFPGQPRFALVLPAWESPDGDWRPEAHGDGLPGSNVHATVSHVLQPDVERAILVMDEGAMLPAVAATYMVEQLVIAANRWLVDTIEAQGDERLSGLAVVPAQIPENAAAEIRRVSESPRIAGVHLRGNALSRPFGHPIFHPIYAAAAETGLPVVIETGGDSTVDTTTHPTAGGPPLTYGEYAALQACALMTHITNMISNGVFTTYPGLKVVLLGGGAAWLPWFLWRSDNEWRAMGREIPWVDVPPSEYFGTRILVGVNPLARGDDGLFDLARLIGSVDGIETMGCYASFYPRAGAETVASAREAFPESWHAPILHDNAERFYRW